MSITTAVPMLARRTCFVETRIDDRHCHSPFPRHVFFGANGVARLRAIQDDIHLQDGTTHWVRHQALVRHR